MNRTLFVLVSMVIMTLLAVISARLLREPYPISDVAASLSPSMTDGVNSDADNLPVTAIVPDEDGESGEHRVAALSADRVAGQLAVTAPPDLPSGLSPGAPLTEPLAAPGTQPPASASDRSAVQNAAQALAHDAAQASGQDAPPADSSPATTESAASAQASGPRTGDAGDASEQAPAQAPTQAPAQASGQTSGQTSGQPAGQSASAPGTDQTAAARPNVLVTRSSLPAKAGQHIVTQATMSMDGDNVILRLEANSPIKASAFLLTGPDRVVMDIQGAWQVEPPRVISNRMVNALRVGNQENATRLVFDMRVKAQRATVDQVSATSIELRIR